MQIDQTGDDVLSFDIDDVCSVSGVELLGAVIAVLRSGLFPQSRTSFSRYGLTVDRRRSCPTIPAKLYPWSGRRILARVQPPEIVEFVKRSVP